MSNFKSLNAEEFEALSETKGVVLLDLFATWCQPCKVYGKILETVSQDANAPLIYQVDIDEQPEIAAKFKVRSVPTTIIFRDGKVDKIVSGSMSKEKILELIK